MNSKTPNTSDEQVKKFIDDLRDALQLTTELLLKTVEYYHLLEKRVERLEERIKQTEDQFKLDP